MDAGIDDDEIIGARGGIDVAEKAYDKSKELFGWSKTLPLVGIVTSTTESLANKGLKLALGTNLPEIDHHVSRTIHGVVDGKILNPILGTAANILMAVGGTTDKFVVTPVVRVVTFPAWLLLKSKSNEQTPYGDSTPIETGDLIPQHRQPTVSTDDMTDVSSLDTIGDVVEKTKPLLPSAAVAAEEPEVTKSTATSLTTKESSSSTTSSTPEKSTKKKRNYLSGLKNASKKALKQGSASKLSSSVSKLVQKFESTK